MGHRKECELDCSVVWQMAMTDTQAKKAMCEPANFEELAEIVATRTRTANGGRPFVVAIDGRSGVGKSTLAAALAATLDAAVIEGDDFYAGGVAVRDDSPADRAGACIDWTQLRAVVTALRQGRDAIWRAFDWEAFDGRLCDKPTVLAARPVLILEGVYSARPELRDILDFAIIVSLPRQDRVARLFRREGMIGRWEQQWHEAEDFYFEQVMSIDRFDAVFDGAAVPMEASRHERRE